MKTYLKPEIKVTSCVMENIMTVSAISSTAGHQGGDDGTPIKDYTVEFNF